MNPEKSRFSKPLLIALSLPAALVLALAVYYFLPSEKIADGVVVDYILVQKSKHTLEAYSGRSLVATYKIATGKNSPGAKEYEGDKKTPEGIYTINSRNPNSGYHKNLGISYPNAADVERARLLDKPTGGDIKIHGLENGKGYIGKLHRWMDWTNGCIALDNPEVDELYEHVKTGAVIEIRK